MGSSHDPADERTSIESKKNKRDVKNNEKINSKMNKIENE
jgi:hypothetical protein